MNGLTPSPEPIVGTESATFPEVDLAGLVEAKDAVNAASSQRGQSRVGAKTAITGAGVSPCIGSNLDRSTRSKSNCREWGQGNGVRNGVRCQILSWSR